MAERKKVYRAISAFTTVLVSLAVISCALWPPSAPSASTTSPPDDSALKTQALVMGMADDYIASLGESVYLLTRSGKLDSKGRWLSQSFLRNGVGASLDIAVGPNPPVNLLDLLVLTALQSWSFEAHWIPAGIGDAGLPALDRLKRAEADVWASAREILSEDQLRTLRNLVGAWIAENSDRTVVALVRFNEFADERRMSSMSLRGEAQGLLQEVDEASAAVDDARLLGERLLWFAGRYPYLLGEQTELTAYRLIDQPEGAQLMEAIKSAQQLSQAFTERIDAFFCTVGHPNEILKEAVSGSRKVRFIPITGPSIDKLIADRKYYTKSTIPVAEFYRDAENAVNVETFGVTATLCTSAHVPDHVVYVITKELFDNFDYFKRQHPAYADLTKEGMLEGLSAPLHTGALKYYKEAGLMP